MNRTFLVGLLGGIAMFIWTSIAHMALPLGEAGIAEMPNETAVLSAMQSSIAEKSGLYIFPGFGLGPNPSKQEQHEAMKHMDKNLAQHPSGILMYHPAGSRPMQMVRWLLVEFATELAEAFLVVYLLSLTGLTTFGGRLGFVVLAGMLAAIATNVSYWNWYGFPTVYTLSYMFIQVVGFLCIGLVAGFLMKPKTAR
ncbi:MAG TPA: hypothetical protein VH207_00715 [Chthoniobacterales bacterium]|jgi:hypothetical protein|nr:hypothetical protein [Chthoniobacterales bacterium]